MGKAFFVTGTDTEVGKTLVTSALLRGAADRGLATLGMKPLAAGSMDSDSSVNDDAVQLMESSSIKLPYQQINPVLLQAPVAPHIAAEQEGKRLSVDRLSGYCRGLRMQRSDLMLVEGAGGWRVPLNGRETLADLAVSLQLPVILVVGMRLGCLNHGILTAEAIRNDGLPLAGWVANFVAPMAAAEGNLQALEQHIPAPCLGVIPYQENVEPGVVIAHLDQGMDYLLSK